MLRVELFTVSPVIPTCSMYLRQFCKLAARISGARYIQMKYRHRPNVAVVQRTKAHTTVVSTNSAQTRRRTRLLRTGEREHKKARRKRNGEENNPKFCPIKAARHLLQRGE